ncbi:polyprenyl synthetase family protein [Schlesneria paludicola]|uniref:polyprenyl synthetase family protein n=1 Tax=Schlesneria paludicola TaxID=360056 RepID=UPI00029ABF8E|nr:farnesyl diphosphate synthase [Schlesneria paludicola]
MSVLGQQFESDLATFRDRVNARLANYVAPEIDSPSKLSESMAYSLLAGGKRLRPILVLLACEACGGDSDAALPAACAIEMIHTYSLIHDDLPAMDDDDYRRGRLTNHKVYGEAMAILAGDALLTLAFEVMARDIQPGGVAAACCADLASAAGWCGMVGGQVADLEAEQQSADRQLGSATDNSGESAGLAQLEAIHRRKTGRLLMSAVTLGARVAQAKPELVNRLEEFGKRVGLAFQIADDLLDVTGDATKLGKNVGKDATLGKMTYPGLLGIDGSRRKADDLIDEACRLLEPLGERAAPLMELARFVTRRDH